MNDAERLRLTELYIRQYGYTRITVRLSYTCPQDVQATVDAIVTKHFTGPRKIEWQFDACLSGCHPKRDLDL